VFESEECFLGRRRSKKTGMSANQKECNFS
jgi:hypothetical protein